jgi:diaminopimelate epimerase
VSEIRFSKYEASGNDFVLIDEGPSALKLEPDQARALCDRWIGVGADGVVIVRGSADRPAFDLTNADGTAAAVSGNGLRCLAAFVVDRGGTETALDVATPAGPRHVTVERAEDGRVRSATVSMGSPNFTKAGIPMRGPAWETFLEQPFDVGGGLVLTASALSMGNPHLVLFTGEDPERYHVEHLGPALEHHELFPERTNVEFARVHRERAAVDVRVWERGVGETLACGTGACAVVVAANEAGMIASEATVRFRGGDLAVRRRDGEVDLTGPVQHVFDGVVEIDRLR